MKPEAGQPDNGPNLHTLAFLAVGLWIWATSGWLWTLGAMAAIYLTIAGSNMFLMSKAASIELIRFNRWLWLLLASIVVLLSSSGVIEG